MHRYFTVEICVNVVFLNCSSDRMIAICTLLAVLALALYLRNVYSKFSEEEVNHLPIVPVFGNLFWASFSMENITEFMVKLCSTFPDDKYVLFIIVWK